MSSIRLSLCAMNYPHVAPNCLVVLQALRSVGFDITLKDMFYHNREDIKEYFEDLGLSVSFDPIKKPEICILKNSIILHSKKYFFSDWRDIDQLCLEQKIYSRNSRYSFVPSYKPDTYFLVLNYGEKTQIVDSTVDSLLNIKHQAKKLIDEGKSQCITIVDANTLQILGSFDKNGFEEFDDIIYFNNEL